MEIAQSEETPKPLRRRSPFQPKWNGEGVAGTEKGNEESASGSASLGKEEEECELSVGGWIEGLELLSPQLQEKYKRLFEEEEIVSIQQVRKLTEKHLHWMGVKTGTLITMIDAIQRLNAEEAFSAFKGTNVVVYNDHLNELGGADEKSPSLPPPKPNDPPPVISARNPVTSQPTQLHQAGGHVRAVTRTKPGFVKKDTDSVEATFYYHFKDSKKIPEQFKSFFPKLDSIVESSTVLGKKISVVMEDLTFSFSKPCIMDIKMGTKTYAEDTNVFKKKIRQLKDDGTTSSRYGLRITGFRTFNVATNQFFEFGREAAERIASIESMEQKIKDFFYNGNAVRKDVILYYIDKLSLLLTWMNTQNFYRFYSSSLLFVYEGQTESIFKADVRMIDFAHVHEIRDSGIDEGYVKGLKKLIEILTKLSL